MSLVNRLVPAALAALCILVAGPAARAQQLDSVLERLRAGSPAADATIGWSVVLLDGDADAPGSILASRNAEEPLVPASNQKLLTTGVALDVLGPDLVWRTEIGVRGERLVVRGSGDPALADPKLLSKLDPPLTAATFLDRVARAVTTAHEGGIAEIVVDDRVFDRELVHPNWPPEQLDRQYCAQVAGVNFHTNVLRFYPRPSPRGVGAVPEVRIEPFATWIELRNDARTVASGRNSFWVTRETGTNVFSVLGQVREPSGYAAEVTFHDPALFFGRMLASSLRKAGAADVSSGTGLEARLAQPGERLPVDRVLVRVTTSMEDVVERTNTDSKNLYAEALLKRVAHEVTGEPGSWEAGAAVVRMVLTERLGPDHAARTIVSDGSGMSRDNRVAPHTFTRWLEVLSEDSEIGRAFIDSLASPGRGTLRRRFLDGSGRPETRLELRAKSGYLDGVRTLSGYLLDPDTRAGVAFSVMINDAEPARVDRACREFLDEAVLEIDEWVASRIARTAEVGGG